MGRSSKPRKAYRPRPVASPLAPEHRQNIEIVAYAMLDNLERGMFEDIDDNTAAYILNLSAHLGHVRERPDVVELAEAGMDALEAVRARRDRTGRYGASGSELRVLSTSLVPLTGYFLSQPQHRIADAAQWVIRENARMRERRV